MVKTTFELGGRGVIAKFFRRYGDEGKRAMGIALFEEGLAILNAAKDEVPVDQGILRASGRVTRPNLRAAVPSVTVGFGGAAAPYAAAVHEGTRPHWPPIAPLIGWVRRHGLPESAAYAIQRKISVQGTAPTKFLERPLRARLPGMAARLARRARRHLRAKVQP